MLDLRAFKLFISITDILHYSASRYPDHPAFTDPHLSITYKELDQLSSYFANYLVKSLGLSKGDRIAIQMPNLVQYPIAVYGALKAGLVVVNTNPLYTGREIIHQFNDSGAKALVVFDILRSLHSNIWNKTPVEHIITVSPGKLYNENAESEMDFGKAIMQGKELSAASVMPMEDDLAFLQYTGGTTGPSKGAMLTQKSVLSNVLQTLKVLETVIEPGKETMIVPLPMYHIYACALSSMVIMFTGAHSVLVSNPRDLNGFIAQINNVEFSIFAGINTLFVGLCQHPEFLKLDFSHLKLTISGGTALTQAAATLWKETTGCAVCEAYGMTEASPAITINDPINPLFGTIGKVVPDTIIRIVDDKGNDVSGPGELWIKGPQVMKGYWNQPEETSNVITEEGWLKTGDIVLKDENGFIKIVDRKKDMIIVSGFNVYPNEIEDVVCKHGKVLECGAVGLPSEKTGEQVAVFIVKKDASLTAEEILLHCSEQLTGYKIPKYLKFVEELPKSNVGKVLRRELKNLA